MRSVSRGLQAAAIRWGGDAPRARPGLRIRRGASRRRRDLRHADRWVSRRRAGHRTDHARSRRSPAHDLFRGRAERGPRTGERREAAPAALHRWKTPAGAASPPAAQSRVRSASARAPLLAQSDSALAEAATVGSPAAGEPWSAMTCREAAILATPSGARCRRCLLRVCVRRVAAVQHELVAVGVGEDRHVADAGVEGVAEEGHALGLELRARRVDVLHA